MNRKTLNIVYLYRQTTPEKFKDVMDRRKAHVEAQTERKVIKAERKR